MSKPLPRSRNPADENDKPCQFRPWFGDDYGAACKTCGASKRGMMANVDLLHECRYTTVIALKPKDNGS